MSRLRNFLISASAFSLFAITACSGKNTDTVDSTLIESDAAAVVDIPLDSYFITMSGLAERPDPVVTSSQAEASLIVYSDSIVYTVSALDIRGVTAIHIHRGSSEESGDIVATLFTSSTGADFAGGTISSGVITRETALADGITFDDLNEIVRSGSAYVNIHTHTNPQGELRGQVIAGDVM